MSETETPEVPMDKLARIYIKIRNRVAELTKAYDAEVETLKAQQDQVAHAMKDRMQALGVISTKTDSGTVSLVTKTRYVAQDWESMKRFVIEHEAVDLLERRIAQQNMAKFMVDNPGLVPSGLNTLSSIEVSVRKPTAKD
jgi:hypothetical protein